MAKLNIMITKRSILSAFFIACLIVACKPTDKKTEDDTSKKDLKIAKKTNPCDSPKTVKELLACAKSVGEIYPDSTQVKLGSDFNQGCGKAWNDNDTVLVVSYKDSISLWRVNRLKNDRNNPKKYAGHWFTNFSAKDSGYTKQQTLNRFALNPCPKDNSSWHTCQCPDGKEPIDTVIQYEEHIRLGPNQPLRFGIVGKTVFGDGGEVQWHELSQRKPPYYLIEQIRWE